MTIKNIKNIKKKYCTTVIEPMLNKKGNKNVNSMSYKIKKIHIIIKFKLIWKFKSEIDLKPHS